MNIQGWQRPETLPLSHAHRAAEGPPGVGEVRESEATGAAEATGARGTTGVMAEGEQSGQVLLPHAQGGAAGPPGAEAVGPEEADELTEELGFGIEEDSA